MKKLGRNRKEEPSGTVVNEKIPQEDQQPGPSQQCNNLAKSSNGESSNEEDDGTTFIICKIPWTELTEKCGDWAQCAICDEYSIRREIFLHWIINIKVRFPFDCPLKRLIMQ